MGTRVWIGLSLAVFGFIAWRENNLAAGYIAIGVHAIIYLLHALEVKVNRLLDERGITVTDSEISRD